MDSEALPDTQFLGKPCKRGHPGARWKANNACVECARERTKTKAHREYQAKWARENSDSQRRWRKENRERVLAMRARERAARGGYPCDITHEDIVIPPVCPVFGTPFDESADGRATLDKVVPSLGYVKGNIRVISGRANRLKSDMSKSDILRLLAYLEECE